MTTHNISILGASGYSGAELLRILLRHPGIRITSVFAHSSAGKKVEELYPVFRSTPVGPLVFQEFSIDVVKNDDLVFIALPSGEAMKYVPGLIDAGKRVVDLGGDFRLHDTALYNKYYKHEHMAGTYLNRAVYGLTEWNRSIIPGAQLLSNPGCYVTSALLPLLPLVKEGLIQSTGITISSLSGVSGAGRSSSVDLSFTETNETVKAYKVGVHQHTPEIETILLDLAGKESTVTFVPHLIPITRGIYSSIYVTPVGNVTADAIAAAYQKYYSGSTFVRLLGSAVPEIKHVQYTNYCDIGWKVYERNNQIILHSVIDNLVKGAAGQAVQNMNLMLGFTESTSLL